MKKIYILVLISLILPFSIFSQTIDLPEVTTVIEGDKIKADSDALPDFNNVLEIPTGSGDITPEIPVVSKENAVNPVSAKDENNRKAKKTLFSEILIGAGYPYLFYGNCSIFGVNQASPFKMTLNFDTASGYSFNKLSDSFADRTLNVTFNKDYKVDKLDLGFYAEYNSVMNGLQKKSEDMANINNDYFAAEGKVEYDLGKNVLVGANVDLDIYNRYGNITADNAAPDWANQSSILTLNPSVYGKWSGHGFTTNLSMEYLLGGNLSNSISGGNNHRGKIKGSVQWNKDYITVFGDFAVAFGNKFTTGSATVPFTIGTDFVFPVYFSNRKVRVGVEGGLESEVNSVKQIENKYRFAALSTVPTETSFWYGKLNFDIPLKSSFTANADIEYKHTAFNNGVWEPDYSGSSFHNGIYEINQRNLNLLITDFNVTYHHKLFSIKGGIRSNWFDVPMLEAMQMITLDLAFQDEKSKWGAGVHGVYNVEGMDAVPVLDLDCFLQLSPAVRLSVELEDIITLLRGSSRKYAGIYSERGFTASVLLNFVL